MQLVHISDRPQVFYGCRLHVLSENACRQKLHKCKNPCLSATRVPALHTPHRCKVPCWKICAIGNGKFTEIRWKMDCCCKILCHAFPCTHCRALSSYLFHLCFSDLLTHILHTYVFIILTLTLACGDCTPLRNLRAGSGCTTPAVQHRKHH